MRLEWNPVNYLFIEAHTASSAFHHCQDLIVESSTPAQPAAAHIKSYSRHQDQVESIQRYRRAGRRWLPYPESPAHHVCLRVAYPAGEVLPLLNGVPGQSDNFTKRQSR
jgi:hypothetical protein